MNFKILLIFKNIFKVSSLVNIYMGIHELFFNIETKACNKYGKKP